MKKYIVEYSYRSFMLGCDCCSDSTSEITIWNKDYNTCVQEIEHVPLIEDENELRDYIEANWPEYADFTPHDYNEYF